MRELTYPLLAQATPSAQTLSAAAASTTAVTAVVATVFALVQLRHSYRIRREQAQPYLAMFMESSTVSPHFVDLVLRNYGTTAARNISIIIEPTPLRASSQTDEPEKVVFPAYIPTLVPNQEWRTLWDFGPARRDKNLEKKHTATISCDGVLGQRQLVFKYELDWALFEDQQWVQTYSIHDAAKALREIERTMHGWREGVNTGLRVYVRDGDAKDERRRQELAQTALRHEELVKRLQPTTEEGETNRKTDEGGRRASPAPVSEDPR